MRRIVKDPVPEFWAAFIRKHPGTRYDELERTQEGRELRQRIRGHMVAHQKKICCYCCKCIETSGAHNEHIMPKSRFPEKSMEYENLLASCTSNTCGMAKESVYECDTFVSPLHEDCEDHFDFLTDGRIEGHTDRGRATVACLNLNDYALVQTRKQQYKECYEMARYMGKEYVRSEYIQEKDGALPRFVDMVTYFYNRGDFDADVCD